MSWIKGPVNAILVATLIRPVARRLLARARRRAQEHPVAPLMVPAEGLFEAALLAELSASAADRGPAPESLPQPDPQDDPVEVLDELAERSAFRTVLLLGLVAASITAGAYAVAILRRRRRDARAAQRQIDLVAVPVEAATEAPAEASVS